MSIHRFSKHVHKKTGETSFHVKHNARNKKISLNFYDENILLLSGILKKTTKRNNFV